jgi:hypothetical protein
MNRAKLGLTLAFVASLATTVALLFLLSTLRAQATALAVDSAAGIGPGASRHPPAGVRQPLPQGHRNARSDPDACTIAIATGDSTVDGRPVLWKNRDYFGRPGAWQAKLFRHEATSRTFSPSDPFSDRFSYVAVSDRGDLSDLQDVMETLYYPRMGANERGLAVVSAQAHTLASDVQRDVVGSASHDPRGVRNGGLNHWILSRCETITQVQQLLAATNDGGGYNGSTARNTATIIAVIDRLGGAAIFEVDGNSFARENITKEFAPLDERPHSSGPPPGGYSGFDYRTNFSRIDFTNTNICSGTYCFPYFPDECTDTIVNGRVVHDCHGHPDGINDLEHSASSVKRWRRVAARMDDGPKDYRYFIQKWFRAYAHPRENYLETVARSVGYAPYLTEVKYRTYLPIVIKGSGMATTSVRYAPHTAFSASSSGTLPHNWAQEKPTGWHLNRFVTVSSAVIVGSKEGDQDEGRLTTMWVALGEPSVAVFVPIFPYAGEPPAVLEDFFLSANAKRRLVYDYGTDADGYPVDNIDPISPYTHLRNADHSIDLSPLFGGNYYGEGGLQAYNFVIEDRLFEAYSDTVDAWRALNATQITSSMLASWQVARAGWAVDEYVKSDPTSVVYQAETDFEHTSGRTATWNGLTAWQFSQDGHMTRTHDFVGPTIVEVIARGSSDSGTWPRMKVCVDGECLTEVGGETGHGDSIVVSSTNATNKAKDVGSDTIDPSAPRFALYRYRTVRTGVAALTIEAVDASSSGSLSVDKVIVRTEPCSVEMFEAEKDWDAKSDECVQIDEHSILLTCTHGSFDVYHYAWGVPFTVEVVAKGYSTNPSPVLELHCNSGSIGTATLTTRYEVYPFDWDPGAAGQVTCTVRPVNDKDVRVDKLLMKERLPLQPNTAPTGCFTVDATLDGPTVIVTATALVTDPDDDDIASYFWDFGDGKSHCSANPLATHAFTGTPDLNLLTLHATDHRGKTSPIPRCTTTRREPLSLEVPHR